MKRIKKNILLVIFLALAGFSAQPQEPNPESLFLFTDRDYCVSGDTVWFKVRTKNQPGRSGNVVHVQLDSPDNNLVASAMVKSTKGWAEGYLAVPDSLSSGIYLISAYLNVQRSLIGLKQLNRILIVYNRFENEVVQMPVIQQYERKYPVVSGRGIQLLTDKAVYGLRETVQVKLNSDAQIFSDLLLSAAVVDSFAAENDGIVETMANNSNVKKDFPPENDGFILNGKVTNNTTGKAASGVVVLLSITRDIPYFDYCVTDPNGRFQFFPGNATGNTTVYLQVLPEKETKFTIHLEKSYLARQSKLQKQIQFLTTEQTECAESLIDGMFYQKVFHNEYRTDRESFSMPPQFPVPFYGEPEERVVPGEYIYLPDFSEISRELLPGIQFREKNGNATLRVLNAERRMFFEDEPLRLLNGIPVFNNNLIKSLDSDDIEFIDFVFKERIYGDLIFNGVLDISLADKSNSWLPGQPQIHTFELSCLQFPKRPGYAGVKDVNKNIPDMRTVFCWEKTEAGGTNEFEFQLSDVKGLVEIVAEGIGKDGRWVKTSKIIEVR